MDADEDWRERAIAAFEAAYKESAPCFIFYPADECGNFFKEHCINCGWHQSEHVEEEAEEGIRIKTT